MARRKTAKVSIILFSGSMLLALYGYPCFFCGATLKACRKRRRCCKRCKGIRSHD